MAASASRRERLLLGDGEGERELDIHGLRAKLDIDPETERVLRSRSLVSPFVRGLDSNVRSSVDSSGPTVNSDIVN